MVVFFIVSFILNLIFLNPLDFCCAQEGRIFFREDFEALDNWGPLYFPKIKQHSSYEIEDDGKEHFLRAESKASASGLILKKEFNVYEFPNMGWRWRAENIYRKGDATTKSGDDYPIRVYIIFKYDPEKAGFFEKLKYNSAKLFYGEYPPHSSLNYIWANKTRESTIITSSYTERSKMIPLQSGETNIGMWQDEEVNILEDYRMAFGEDPPHIASVAIMNDSDNTGEGSVSYIDYLIIYREGMNQDDQ